MSIPKQHKALYVFEKGGPLTVKTIDVQSPGPDDVLLRVEAAGLNPADWKIQMYGGIVGYESWPQILGFDGAGVVAAVGSNVTRLKVGDRVLAQGHLEISARMFQQYVVTGADFVVKIPDDLSFDEAATLPASAGTAVAPLYNQNPTAASVRLVAPWEEGGRGKYAGTPAVVLGGASMVGQGALQFLRLSGFSPIITTASLRNSDLVKAYGATHVVDRTLPASAVAAEIKRIAGGPITLVYDAISLTETKNLAFDVLAPGGSLVLVLPEDLDGYKRPEGAQANVMSAAGELSFPQNRYLGIRFATEFEKLLQQGLIKPGIPEVLPGGLHGVKEGLDRLRADQVSGRKLVVHPQDTA